MDAYYYFAKFVMDYLILAVKPQFNGEYNEPFTDDPSNYVTKGCIICSLIENNTMGHHFDTCRTFDPTFMFVDPYAYTMCSYFEKLGKLIVEYLAWEKYWILTDMPTDIKENLDRLAHYVYEFFLQCANYYVLFFKSRHPNNDRGGNGS